MQNTLFVQVLVGLLIGGGLGAAMGHFGKCATGVCPLTANPLRGGVIGSMLGGLLAFSAGSSRLPAETHSSGNLDINDAEDFDVRVLGSQQPVLVDFYSDSCGPCRMLAPTIEKLAGEYAGRAAVLKVNVERLPELANRYGIQGIPAVLFFQRGEQADRLIGLRPQSAYSEVLDKLIDAAT